MHESIGRVEKIEIVEKFIQQLKTSGYSTQQARQAVVNGLVGVRRKIDRKKKLGEDIYRSAASTLKPKCEHR